MPGSLPELGTLPRSLKDGGINQEVHSTSGLSWGLPFRTSSGINGAKAKPKPKGHGVPAGCALKQSGGQVGRASCP